MYSRTILRLQTFKLELDIFFFSFLFEKYLKTKNVSVLVLNLNMMHKLHEFVSPFTLYFNVENAQYLAGKHFEKSNTSVGWW